MDIINQVTPLFTQTEFWLRLVGTVVVWYALALAFSHLLFGTGREAVSSAIGGMWIALGVVLIVLASATWFWWSPRELIYTFTITLTFVLITLLFLAVLARLGSRES